MKFTKVVKAEKDLKQMWINATERLKTMSTLLSNFVKQDIFNENYIDSEADLEKIEQCLDIIEEIVDKH